MVLVFVGDSSRDDDKPWVSDLLIGCINIGVRGSFGLAETFSKKGLRLMEGRLREVK